LIEEDDFFDDLEDADDVHDISKEINNYGKKKLMKKTAKEVYSSN